MDWANVTKIKPLHLPNVISRPDEHALHKDNFATRNDSRPSPEAALLLVLSKRSAASGDESARRECRKLLLTSNSVMGMCCSCFINTKY